MALNLFSLPGVDSPAKPKPPASPEQAPIQPVTPNPTGDVVFDFGTGDGGNPAAAKAAALKGIEIEKARLEYQKNSGLRDITQAREEGLSAAINNALQRGIYRSGIRQENEARVNRESDESEADLQAEIGFALDLLKQRAASIKAGGSGGGAGGFSFGMDEMLRWQGMRSEYGVTVPKPAGTDSGQQFPFRPKDQR